MPTYEDHLEIDDMIVNSVMYTVSIDQISQQWQLASFDLGPFGFGNRQSGEPFDPTFADLLTALNVAAWEFANSIIQSYSDATVSVTRTFNAVKYAAIPAPTP